MRRVGWEAWGWGGILLGRDGEGKGRGMGLLGIVGGAQTA